MEAAGDTIDTGQEANGGIGGQSAPQRAAPRDRVYNDLVWICLVSGIKGRRNLSDEVAGQVLERAEAAVSSGAEVEILRYAA